MPDIEDPTSHRQRQRKKENHPRSSLFVIAMVLLVLLVGAGIFLLNGPRQHDRTLQYPESKEAVSEKPVPPESRFGQMEPSEQPAEAQTPGETGQIKEPGVSGPMTAEQTESEQTKHERECNQLGNNLYDFFLHIDSEEYLKPFALQEPSKDHFIRLAYKLLDNPPVVTRESDDLYTILKNMAHFFRVIGKDNILLIKAILDRERDKIEDVASELYQWLAIGDCKNDRFEFNAPLDKVYEYAGFFLNTMGGRSYLFRRDSRSRLLVNYYSILIVASADDKGLNRHGIDISLLIPQMIQEIETTNQLIYKENYLDQLYGLLEKYQ